MYIISEDGRDEPSDTLKTWCYQVRATNLIPDKKSKSHVTNTMSGRCVKPSQNDISERFLFIAAQSTSIGIPDLSGDIQELSGERDKALRSVQHPSVITSHRAKKLSA